MKYVFFWYFAFRFGLAMLGADVYGQIFIGPFDDILSCEKAKVTVAEWLDDKELLKQNCKQAKGDEA